MCWTAKCCRIYYFSSEDGEKKDRGKGKEAAPQESLAEEKKALKKRISQKKQPLEAFMASFFASLEIYQTKMLVRHFPHSCLTEIRSQLFYPP